jgi:hypothetical protein
MFKYNGANFTIEDADRGLVVKQTGGPGHGIYAGEMSSADWRFKVLVHRAEASADGQDGKVELRVRVYPPKGDFNMETTPFELAREAAIAREIGFYRTDAGRIETNAQESGVA